MKCFQDPYRSLKPIYRRQRTGGLDFRQIMGFYVQIKEGFTKGNSKKSKKSCFFVISSPNSSKTTKVEQVCNPTFFLIGLKQSFPIFKIFENFQTKKPIHFENHLYSRLENVTFTFTAQKVVKIGKNRHFSKKSKNLHQDLSKSVSIAKIGPELYFLQRFEVRSYFAGFSAWTSKKRYVSPFYL